MNLHSDEGEQLMHSIRSQILEFIERHEATVHDGAACWPSRLGIVAFLCHSLALRGPQMQLAMAQEIGEYDRRCEDRQCRHRLN